MAKQIKLQPTPTILEKDKFEVVYDNPEALKKNVKPDIYQVNAYVKDCQKWGTSIQITEWANKTGFDITLCGSHGSFQHMSITREEGDIIIEAINKLK